MRTSVANSACFARAASINAPKIAFADSASSGLIVHTPLRMPLHRQHKMSRSSPFQRFDDSVFRATRHHAQPIARRIRRLVMRRIHRHRLRSLE